jgi:hypothetical protein
MILMAGRKVSSKTEWREQYKWAKVYGFELEEIKKRLSIIEEKLGIESKDDKV